ncbi:hypothetical protein HanXRQr2_Chr01g0002581 [Helianthus annuus]|uniref:Uncharacterized protein n=1 Tax=Helianthus annuus TaxID=4232 RepID=A0A9K3JTM8_HELAN|nr:hypothetical protein HanXRQr2_Chr01g0002581 [Helianthus annuus]
MTLIWHVSSGVALSTHLLSDGLIKFYNLVSTTESETKGTKMLKMTKIKKKKAASNELPTITLCQFLKMAKDGFW